MILFKHFIKDWQAFFQGCMG